jgi:hypothetical protein
MNAMKMYSMSAALGVVGAVAGGCAVAPEPEPVAQSTAAALCTGIDCPDPPRCIRGYQFNSSRFERDLAALGCSGKSLWQSNGGGTGWFVTSCSTLATVYAWCPSDATYTTMDVYQLAWCYANDPVVQPMTDARDPCTGVSRPDQIVLWDPTCGGTECQAPW